MEMKKLAAAGLTILSLLTPSAALAQNITITEPGQGFKNLGDAISKVLTVSFLIALITVLVMLIWGAFEWITSGGDKEAVGKARGRIINALIGLAVLAIAFALFRFAGQFLGITGVPDQGPINIPIPKPL